MKKIYFFIMILNIFLISSCDVPIQINNQVVGYIPFSLAIVFLIIFIMVIVFIPLMLMAKNLERHTWGCSNCGHRFNRKWRQLMFVPYANNTSILKCPECKKRCSCSYRL